VNEIALQLPKTLSDERVNLIALTEGFTCAKTEDLQVGSQLVAGWKALKKAIQDYWREPKESASKTHKRICALENADLDPIDRYLSKVKDASDRYLAEQRRIAEDAERKARAEVEEARRQAEQEARIAAALQAKNSQAAVAIWEEPVPTPTPVAVVAPIKVGLVAGVKTRKVWKSRVTDMVALLDSIAKNETPLAYVQSVKPSRELCALAVSGAIPTSAFILDEKAINSLATAQRETFRMAGIEAHQEETIL